MRLPMRSLALSAFLIAGILDVHAAAAARPSADTEAALPTQSGWIRGHDHGGVTRYLGIPYATPPVGNLRWKAPRDPAPWDGVRDANQFGNACAQIGNFYASDNAAEFDKPYGSEDCLYLNVWAPPGARERPVLVFIHGGGGVFGAASYSAYEASRLSRELDAVVVSINYRLGIFGSIDHPALQAGISATETNSLWLLDQIKALEWVQRNIGEFGGDADNVTVMGHSAGGVSIWAMLRSPLAKGKFAKTIVLSAFPVFSEPEELAERTDKFLENLMRQDGSIEQQNDFHPHLDQLGAEGLGTYLYAKSADELTEAARGLRSKVGGGDEEILRAPASDPRKDFPDAVPMMFGTVDNEASMLFLLEGFSKLTPLQFWDAINSERGDLRRSDFFTWFGHCRFRVSVAVANILLQRQVTEAANRYTKAGAPVYRYRFTWNEQPKPWKDILGAYHGLDVPFLFGNFHADYPNFGRFSWTPESANRRETLHSMMASALKGFIESGDPNQYATQTSWPRWSETHEMAVIQ